MINKCTHYRSQTDNPSLETRSLRRISLHTGHSRKDKWRQIRDRNARPWPTFHAIALARRKEAKCTTDIEQTEREAASLSYFLLPKSGKKQTYTKALELEVKFALSFAPVMRSAVSSCLVFHHYVSCLSVCTGHCRVAETECRVRLFVPSVQVRQKLASSGHAAHF